MGVCSMVGGMDRRGNGGCDGASAGFCNGDGILGTLDGGISSGSGTTSWAVGGRFNGKLPKTSFRLFPFGVAMTWMPCAKKFLTGFLGSAVNQ